MGNGFSDKMTLVTKIVDLPAIVLKTTLYLDEAAGRKKNSRLYQ
jgi:hypothetical protein